RNWLIFVFDLYFHCPFRHCCHYRLLAFVVLIIRTLLIILHHLSSSFSLSMTLFNILTKRLIPHPPLEPSIVVLILSHFTPAPHPLYHIPSLHPSFSTIITPFLHLLSTASPFHTLSHIPASLSYSGILLKPVKSCPLQRLSRPSVTHVD